MASADSSTAAPSAVSVCPSARRSDSVRPRVSSSPATRRPTVAWLTRRVRAAADRRPARASATKKRRSSQSSAAEAVVTKALPNSFAGTDLHARLQATGRKELIIAGFMTHMCVSATTRAAMDLGYRNTVVAAATAPRSLPVPTGGVVPAAELQRTELAALADMFAVVVRDAGAWK